MNAKAEGLGQFQAPISPLASSSSHICVSFFVIVVIPVFLKGAGDGRDVLCAHSCRNKE